MAPPQPATAPPGSRSRLVLVYALVIALVVIATGAALASRSLFSTFGASFNQDTRRAHEAAEVGIQRTISELNRERNRGLLAVSPAAGGVWSAAEVAANPNRCAQSVNDAARPATADLDRIRSGGVAGTFTANPVVYVREDGTLVAEQEAADPSTGRPANQPDRVRTDNVRYAYQLVSNTGIDNSISVEPPPYVYKGGRDSTGSLTRTANLRIQMRGFSYNNGQLTGSTTLEQQIEVVPKCCGRSLANFGSDLRSCTQGLGEGYGILLLSKGSGQGEIGEASLTGQISSNEAPDKTIDPIVCIAAPGSQCKSSVSVAGGTANVIVLPPADNFPDADVFPFGGVTPGTLVTCKDDSAGCASNAFRSDAGTKTVIDASTINLASLPTYCKSNSISGVVTIHCLLKQMTIKQQNLEIRTSSTRRLKFYFPEEDQKSGPDKDMVTDVINVQDTSTIIHFNTNPPSTTAPIDKRLNDAASVLQLQFFGCRKDSDNAGCEDDSNTTNTQTYKFNGNSGTGTDPVFFYFPIGDLTIDGGGGTGPQFDGVLWTNTLIGKGGVEIRVPGSGVNSLLASYGVIDNTNSGLDKPILWDFVARAVRSFRLRQGT